MKIMIPQPCSKTWENMTPNEQGRFCDSCQKTVVDFTLFSTTDIQNYFSKHYGQKVCGRFKNEQLATINIEIPSAVLNQIPAGRNFALALLIVFGTTLFSCTDNEGKQVKINGVEITDSQNKKETNPLIGATVVFKPIEKKRKEANNAKQIPTLIGEVETQSFDSMEGVVCDLPLINPPEFIGGEDSLTAFIEKHLTRPQKFIQSDMTGKIIIGFYIETDGSTSNVKIIRGLNNEWDNEAVKVVKSMPKWKPGEENGTLVRSGMALPIIISE